MFTFPCHFHSGAEPEVTLADPVNKWVRTLCNVFKSPPLPWLALSSSVYGVPAMRSQRVLGETAGRVFKASCLLSQYIFQMCTMCPNHIASVQFEERVKTYPSLPSTGHFAKFFLFKFEVNATL